MVLIKFKCYKKIYRLKKIKKFVLNLRRYIYKYIINNFKY